MSDIIKDGGPAFPAVKLSSRGDGVLHSDTAVGMSLRDWFAGMALQGGLAYKVASKEVQAEMAYKYADAMLAEREKDKV